MRFNILSENSLIIQFGHQIDEPTAELISQIIPLIKRVLKDNLIDMVPAYTTIHLSFRCQRISAQEVIKLITEGFDSGLVAEAASSSETRNINIPVYYGEEFGVDLPFLSKQLNLTIDDIIRLHSEKIYRVYAIGFTPGYAFMGALPDSLVIPRRTTPRLKVPAKSVAMAAQQTAIYPTSSPGGWHILGRTPIDIVDFSSKHLGLFQIGDKIKFTPISREKFAELGGCFED